MPKIKNLKIITISAIIFGVLFSLILLLLVFSPWDNLNPYVVDADKVMRGESKILSLKIYEKAEDYWPLLKYNYNFLNKKAKAKKAQDDYLKESSIVIFLKDEVSVESGMSLVGRIRSFDGVREVIYISKEKALEIYRERNKNEPGLLELVSINSLPASIDVYLNDWSQARSLKNQFEKYPEVDAVTLPAIILQ